MLKVGSRTEKVNTYSYFHGPEECFIMKARCCEWKQIEVDFLFPYIVYTIEYIILPGNAKKQYLLTLQVSKYCLFVLHKYCINMYMAPG